MASWARRLTSLAMVFALSASPAALSACMALCLLAVPAAALPPATGPAVASGHVHHASTASPEPFGVGEEVTPSVNVSVSASCNDCCPDGVAFVGGPGVERWNAKAFRAAQAMSPIASFLLTPALDAVAASPPVPPPSPARAPLVLLI